MNTRTKPSLVFVFVAIAIMALPWVLAVDIGPQQRIGQLPPIDPASGSLSVYSAGTVTLQAIKADIAQLDKAVADAERLIISNNNRVRELARQNRRVESGWRLDINRERTHSSLVLGPETTEFAPVTSERPVYLPQGGDQVELPLLYGQSATVEVDHGEFSRNGDYSWSGHLQDYGSDYPIVVTYGDKSSFAMITTPQGSYSMESINGQGWLYKNRAEEELGQLGVKDYLDIDH